MLNASHVESKLKLHCSPIIIIYSIIYLNGADFWDFQFNYWMIFQM